MEIWKDIKGYEGLYQVSDLGRVKSLERKVRHRGRLITIKEKYLKINISEYLKGYRKTSIGLYKGGKKVSTDVHTLVAEAFLGERPNAKAEIRHINGDSTDNRLSNLIYGSSSDNRIDMYRYGSKTSRGKLDPSEVIEIRKELDSGLSARKLAEKYGVHESSIRKIKNRKTFSWLDDNGDWRDFK